MLRLLTCLLCLGAVWLDARPALSRNIALVIGNNDYANVPKLAKAVGDARVMEAVLTRLGFTVLSGEDVTYLETVGLIANLENQIEPGDTVFFHFSGHGVAIDAGNFLLPVDVPKPDAGEEGLVKRYSIRADDLVSALQTRGARIVISVLDACRDNPFAASGVRNIGATRGLARIVPPRGSFIFYSAGAGQVALDALSDSDKEPASVFTRVLAEVIEKPGLSLVEIAKETQLKVRDLAASTGRDQVPAYYDEIVGNIVLGRTEPSKLGAGHSAPTISKGSPVGSAEDAHPPENVEVPSAPTAVVSIAPPGPGVPPARSIHGDWQVRCDTPAGAQNEQCVLMQFVTAEDRDNVGLTVIVLKTADKKAKIMRILAPLGVLLPSGVGLKIDETDMGRAGFVRCLPNGCVAEVILEDNLLDKLKVGQTATFIIFQTPDEGIGIPIALNGFGPGFETLP